MPYDQLAKNKILVVEDEPAIANALAFSLNQNGFNATIVNLGGDALAVIKSQQFDLAILDVGLPDIDGFELCKKLQQQVHLPVIFLTARSDEIDRVVGLEIGADDYVCKPFSPRELIARIKIILKRHQPRENSKESAAFADFEWDEAAHKIAWKGQWLELTRYEIAILLLLLKAPSRIFSREEIMAHVWVAPEHSLDRTVDTHIKTLRAKLRLVDATQEVVITHRGLGYSLSNKLAKLC